VFILKVRNVEPVPIIAVFTKYDYLVMKKELELYEDKRTTWTEDEIHSLARTLAYQSFIKDCIMPMKKVKSDMPCVFVSGGHSLHPLTRLSLTRGFDK